MSLLLALSSAAALQGADTVHYRLYKFERAVGEERDSIVRSPAGDTTRTHFQFSDRGTAVPLEATLVTAAAGTPSALTARGRTSSISASV